MTEFDPQATLAIGQPQLHVLKATRLRLDAHLVCNNASRYAELT
jgi:hypothetical protein